MAVNGIGQYNNHWNRTQSTGRPEGDHGRKHGHRDAKVQADTKTDSVTIYEQSDEVKKDIALAKASGINYDLAIKGQRYESMSKSDSEMLKKAYEHAQKGEDFAAALVEWGKLKQVKADAAKDTAAPAETAKTEETQTAGTAAPKKAETYKPDFDKIRSMKAEMRNNMSAFKQMVSSMIKDQGGVAGVADGTLKSLLGDLSGISQTDAQAAIADDGYWGVDQTAGRILDFAKALSGGDPSKIALLKDAVQKGFAAAGKVWGGDLPGISHQTLAKVMQGFDEWEQSANGTSQVAETAATK